MKIIEAIDIEQQQQVVSQTHKYIERAEKIFAREFALIPVKFDLLGRAAGMYKVMQGSRIIRYNPHIFAKYFEDNLALTIPHEVAHYVTDIMYGYRRNSLFRSRRIKPHGEEWQNVMSEFGVDATRTCDFNLEGIPQRTHKYFDYVCRCSQHKLGSRRHNKVIKGENDYFCKRCGDKLNLIT
jgi:SprT protein